MFAGHKLPEDFQTNTVKDIIDYYDKLSEEYGFLIDPPDHSMMFEGVKLNQQRKTKEAIELFEYQLSLYPKSLNALWQLGELYRGMGEFETARGYYIKFLEIRDTDVAMIRTRLSQVEKIINESAAYRIDKEIDKNGLEAGLRKYDEIRNNPESHLYFAENEFNALGYRLMAKGEMRVAIEVFKLNVSLYPDSPNVYDSLGEAYMNSGDIKNAIKSYKKSLELDPENANAIEMLKKLERR